MAKKLTKHGNSYALVIERPILEMVGIDPDTELEIATDGQVLIVSPVRDRKHRKKFETALAKVNRKYGRALKRLADPIDVARAVEFLLGDGGRNITGTVLTVDGGWLAGYIREF